MASRGVLEGGSCPHDFFYEAAAHRELGNAAASTKMPATRGHRVPESSLRSRCLNVKTAPISTVPRRIDPTKIPICDMPRSKLVRIYSSCGHLQLR